nr:MAG TPA: hypothetical protein [Caudoviricetes sp.]
MKKFIIKNADGSEQTVMQAVHNSRKEAVETFMDYICDQKNFLSIDDDDYLSPFDFILEEVECGDINEVITDFESAREMLGLKALGFLNKFDDVTKLISDINPKHIKALIALNELFTIAQAWNKEDGFVPDFSDKEQDKWFPWFEYNRDAAGFVYVVTNYSPTIANAYLGSRLCFKTSKRAEQFGKQFEDLYNMVFL